MKILVTGAHGFIGSAIARRYAALGHEGHGFDHRAQPFRSVTDWAAIERAMEDFKPDVVSHHAANVDIQRAIDDPGSDAHANVVGTAIVATAAVKYGVKRLIYASSSSCYGQQDVQPVSETAIPQPLNPYGWSKYAGEFYARRHGNAVIFRYGNVYGPGQSISDRGVIGIFARQLLAGEQPTIFGDALHDYIYIDDVVDANVRALACEPATMNIGSGTGTSTSEILALVQAALDIPTTPRRQPAQRGTYDHMVLDASLARSVMGWKPQWSLESGIAQVCRWVSRWVRQFFLQLPLGPMNKDDLTRYLNQCIGRLP